MLSASRSRLMLKDCSRLSVLPFELILKSNCNKNFISLPSRVRLLLICYYFNHEPRYMYNQPYFLAVLNDILWNNVNIDSRYTILKNAVSWLLEPLGEGESLSQIKLSSLDSPYKSLDITLGLIRCVKTIGIQKIIEHSFEDLPEEIKNVFKRCLFSRPMIVWNNSDPSDRTAIINGMLHDHLFSITLLKKSNYFVFSIHPNNVVPQSAEESAGTVNQEEYAKSFYFASMPTT